MLLAPPPAGPAPVQAIILTAPAPGTVTVIDGAVFAEQGTDNAVTTTSLDTGLAESLDTITRAMIVCSV